MKKNLLFIFFIITTPFYSQQNENENQNHKYFEDGGLSERKNLIKLDLFSILNGDVPFFYERVLSDNVSIEIGAGFQLPFYNNELPYWFDAEKDASYYISNIKNGYSLWLMPNNPVLNKF